MELVKINVQVGNGDYEVQMGRVWLDITGLQISTNNLAKNCDFFFFIYSF